MLPSPATERRKSRTSLLELRSIRCEAQRDLVSARAREHLNQHNRQRGSPNWHFETPHANVKGGEALCPGGKENRSR